MRRRSWLVIHGALLATGALSGCNCDQGYRGGYYAAPPYARPPATYAQPAYSGTSGTGTRQPAMPPPSAYDSPMPQGSGSRMPAENYAPSVPQGSGSR